MLYYIYQNMCKHLNVIFKMDIDTDIENNLIKYIINDENQEILNLDVEWNDKLESAAKDIGDSAKGYKIIYKPSTEVKFKI